jgi:hypothetical protein
MKRSIAILIMTAGVAFASSAQAQGTLDKVVKVGSLGDQSGLYQDIGGPGSTVAAQMAIEDSGLLAKGWKIDLISGDHQNKPDVGANIAKQWIYVEALGGNPHDGRMVAAKMKELPTDDPLFGKGSIRADGRKIHPAYLFEVKKPSESKYPWDYYKLVATIPADEAFIPLEKSVCPMVKKS